MTRPTQTHRSLAARSFLYVPGNRPEMLAKALTRGADAVIVDLEDGVPPSAKDAARDAAAAWISENSDVSTDLWVRLNPSLGLLKSDLDAVVGRGLEGVYLPKTSSALDVERASHMIDELEDTEGLLPGSIRIVPLLETAASILNIPDIAASPRVSHMAIGETDLVADLGMHPSPDGHELNSIRLSVVVASAANRLNRPVGPVQTAFDDLKALHSTSLMLRRLGYGGRAAIHPSQIPVINEAFTPTLEEIESASNVLERFNTAQDAGEAVTVAEDGSLIDVAVVRKASLILAESSPQKGE